MNDMTCEQILNQLRMLLGLGINFQLEFEANGDYYLFSKNFVKFGRAHG